MIQATISQLESPSLATGSWDVRVVIDYDRLAMLSRTMTRQELDLMAALGSNDTPVSAKLLGLAIVVQKLEGAGA